MKRILFFIAASLMSLLSCNEPTEESGTGVQIIPDCRRFSPFITTVGFNAQRSAFSTSDRKIKGLTLVELSATAGVENRVYQHPSWKQAGSMGPIVITEDGSVYAAPIPVVNVLENDPLKQNIIYKVDPSNGEMKPFIELPSAEKPTAENPFGILGLAYDCESGILYATSVSGSTRSKEAGRIFSIQTKNEPKVIDIIEHTDAMGVDICYFNDQKTLFFGKTRTSDIFSVAVKDNGSFKGKPVSRFSLEGVGPRGDDKARKIRFDKVGSMIVHGVEFYYNLIAPTEKQETMYQFNYNLTEGKWEYKNKGQLLQN